MANGTVKVWNSERAYGFIAADDGTPDVFVHITGLVGSCDKLSKDQRVSYQTLLDERSGKLKASNVRII